MSQNQTTGFRSMSDLARASRVSVTIDIDTFLEATGNDHDEFDLRELFPELNAGFGHNGGEL